MPVWDYDLIIIGNTPAGLTGGIFAGRARPHGVRLTKLRFGGQLDADGVVPGPGFPDGINALQLSDNPHQQPGRFELLMENGEIAEIIPGQLLPVAP